VEPGEVANRGTVFALGRLSDLTITVMCRKTGTARSAWAGGAVAVVVSGYLHGGVIPRRRRAELVPRNVQW
jgi:hypothetical protein